VQRQYVETILDADGPEMDLQLEALVMAHVWLRGGERSMARFVQAGEDAKKWIARHGWPTREKLLAWADELGVEAEIPEPLVRMNVLAADPPPRLMSVG
jgi:hypothetical protein